MNLLLFFVFFKGTVHSKNILTHPHVVPNLCFFHGCSLKIFHFTFAVKTNSIMKHGQLL